MSVSDLRQRLSAWWLIPLASAFFLLAVWSFFEGIPPPARTSSGRRDVAGLDDASWRQLSPEQQTVLLPLKGGWRDFDGASRQRWLQVASRLQGRPLPEQTRAQARMLAWAQMPQAKRSEIRLHFTAVRRFPAEQRRREWDKYRAAPHRGAPGNESLQRYAAVAPASVRVKPGATTVPMSADAPHFPAHVPSDAAGRSGSNQSQGHTGAQGHGPVRAE